MVIQVFGDFGNAGSSVFFYNRKGELSCVLPPYVYVERMGDSDAHENYVEVRLPKEYHRKCGSVGLVKRSRSVDSEPEDVEPEYERRPSRGGRNGKSRWDLSFLPVQKKQTTRNEDLSSDGEDDDGSGLEATGGEVCWRCQQHSELEELTHIGRRTHERASRYQCEARGNDRPSSRRYLRESMQEIIDDYSERAQGAIRRGFLSLVPPETSQDYDRLRSLTNNFQDFDSVDPIALIKLMRRPATDCYKFVKAALSNDYSRLKYYNQTRWGNGRLAANTKLVSRFCGGQTGDLTDEYWLNAPVGAGTAGPQLEKRGFINLMDSKYGVSGQYRSEQTAPEGAVLVYKCANHGQILPASKCYGDIAIKTKTGYLRDFFTPYELTRKRTRVLVGIYIKPGGPE